jgi:hypothetical protein
MLSTNWTDPRTVDYSDAFNPLARPDWSANNNPFLFRAFNDPLWVALRNAPDLEPRVWVMPAQLDQIIQPGASYDANIPVEPFTWLYGLSCSATHADGSTAAAFTLQITDAVTGAQVFSQPILSSQITPAGTPGLFFLQSPHLFLPPSYPMIRIINNDAAAALCIANLFCAVEVS